MSDFEEALAFAHAINQCLIDLDAHFDRPVQGEASHKVIGWNARRALRQVGWLGPIEGTFIPLSDHFDPSDVYRPVYVIEDPEPNP